MEMLFISISSLIFAMTLSILIWDLDYVIGLIARIKSYSAPVQEESPRAIGFAMEDEEEYEDTELDSRMEEIKKRLAEVNISTPVTRVAEVPSGLYNIPHELVDERIASADEVCD